MRYFTLDLPLCYDSPAFSAQSDQKQANRMAKKSSRKKRRQRQTNVPQYTPPTQPLCAAAAEPVTAAAPTRATQTTRSGMDSVDWPAEYPFVTGDLRSMAIVAALMVALLLVLNFFLH